jgi:hypothetical protein
MTKEQTLQAIKKAKEAHEAQMQKIEAAIEGSDIENPTALQKTNCDFGKWLYNPENHMVEIIGSQFYASLDFEHENWHREYAKIYNILFASKKKGLFATIFRKKSIDPLELDKVKLYYAELQETTAKLLQILASSQRRIAALPESKFT